MNRPDYASALFTIDGEGRVVGHAKYSGPKCIELLNAVKQIANDADAMGKLHTFIGECGPPSFYWQDDLPSRGFRP